MAGSNRSGNLRNAQHSIPRGTIAAILTTSTLCILSYTSYASSVLRHQRLRFYNILTSLSHIFVIKCLKGILILPIKLGVNISKTCFAYKSKHIL